ncbi:YtpI family protein [Brevibacillus humidisoli]|uniref:YtpI family protein n=1 Tax=Brevibacillus humidisoli TaxID=2895522 RepID=UPI001E38B5E4|nr:YtpI family protein [Brevibacillus humidisoli]UFJ41516.1 YtpI family protein [Brevibacillus humidisoli]
MWTAFYATGLLASLVGSVYYSVMARRSGIHPLQARMTLGKMNMALGVLMLLFGCNQFTYEPLTTVRLIVALVFLFVGGVNLIAGTRRYLSYRHQWKESERHAD